MVSKRKAQLCAAIGLGPLLVSGPALAQSTVSPTGGSAFGTGALPSASASAPPVGQLQSSGGSAMPSVAAAPPTAAAAAATPAVPTATSGTQTAPAVLPTAGPAPAFNVQFPPAQVTAFDGTMAPLYGTSLFTGAFAGSTESSRDDYVIQIGDTIEVKTFGNMSLDVVNRVDGSGRLFLPIIGPVSVAGVTRGSLNATMQTAISALYSNTRVYADIIQPGSVGVFVSGFIQRPGRYLGEVTDSILYYLDKAGGIDGLRGSFRDVVVRHRDGREEHFDLYDFLSSGRTDAGHFADGDVIVVLPRGPQVVVTGMVLQPYAFELKLPRNLPPSADVQAGYAGAIPDAGRQLLALAKPNTRLVTGAYVRSVRDREPVSSYLPYPEFAATGLGDGDHVEFRSDLVAPTIAVSLTVTQPIPSVFVVPRTATLQDVLSKVPQDSPIADYRSVYILRKSVAKDQKALLNDALLRIQKDTLAATALNLSANSNAASAAGLLPQYVAAASQAIPSGQIAIYRNGRFENIRLEDGDQIVIPDKSDVVQVGGEAVNPGGFAFRPNARVADYVHDAGGFSSAADRHKFVLKKQNGVAMVVRGGAVPEPGDMILVVPHVRGQALQAIQAVTSLLTPAVVAAAAVSK